ncbi:hypothetical protein [Candidatus Halobonum tyrrellensis]|uniref:DUF7968 domain-containing protein n=1 Tax=Candidatus Halobonum tyrrellensis G22 TaxID=1324957 RepID=V4GQQ7_9EURY|nr:hypothetical protein [Candidatus Halobonum tyrrellensis]ESP87371.1 hypothetical protein K933_14833 [Candidatus Halobonum tyrrellensis G22]
MSSETNEADDAAGEGRTADRATLSYPDALGGWSREQVLADRYRTYLGRAFAGAGVGHERDEFVDVGCCGNSPRFTVRVESLEGGDRVGEDTELELVERREDVESGWAVQSEAAPE